MVARKGVVAFGHLGHIRDRHQTRRWRFREFLQPVVQGPQNQPKPGGRGLQQRGQKDGKLPKADAMLSQGATGFLIKLLDLGGHGVAGQDAHGFGKPEGKAAGKAGQPLIPRHGEQGFKLGRHLAVDEMLQTAADLVHHLGSGLIVDKGINGWLCSLGPFYQLAHRVGAPHQAALFGKIKLGVWRVVKAVSAQVKLGPEGLNCRLRQRAGSVRRRRCILLEAESFQLAGEFALDGNFAFVVHFGHQSLLLLQPAKQDRCPPVNKSLRQGCVKRI